MDSEHFNLIHSSPKCVIKASKSGLNNYFHKNKLNFWKNIVSSGYSIWRKSQMNLRNLLLYTMQKPLTRGIQNTPLSPKFRKLKLIWHKLNIVAQFTSKLNWIRAWPSSAPACFQATIILNISNWLFSPPNNFGKISPVILNFIGYLIIRRFQVLKATTNLISILTSHQAKLPRTGAAGRTRALQGHGFRVSRSLALSLRYKGTKSNRYYWQLNKNL